MLTNKKYILIFVCLILIFVCAYYFFIETKRHDSHNTKKIHESVLVTPTEQENVIRTDSIITEKNNISLQQKNSMAPLNKDENEEYIVDCTTQTLDSLSDERKLIEQPFADYLKNLEQSDKLENKLAKLIQGPADESVNNLPLFLELFEESPLNKIIYSNILQSCIEQLNKGICNNDLFSLANKIDIDNAMLWHSIAEFHSKTDNLQGVIQALSQANRKRKYDEYYFENISLIEHQMRLNSNLSFKQRMIKSLEFTPKNRSSLFAIYDFCKENYFNSIEITDICYQTALQLESQSQTSITRLIAFALQKQFHQYNNNIDALNDIEVNTNEKLSFIRNKNYERAMALLFVDEELARDWLALSLIKGEQIATEQLVKDAILHSKNPHYNPCPKNIK